MKGASRWLEAKAGNAIMLNNAALVKDKPNDNLQILRIIITSTLIIDKIKYSKNYILLYEKKSNLDALEAFIYEYFFYNLACEILPVCSLYNITVK